MFLEKIKSIQIENNDLKCFTLKEFCTSLEEQHGTMNGLMILNTQNKSIPDVLHIDFTEVSKKIKKALWKSIRTFSHKITIKFT